MSYLFLSHSSENNAQALALEQWLENNGWSELFIDISDTRGLEPGSHWQAELKKAAHRCEAVIFLLSRAWNDSAWCVAEFILAKQLGKQVFGVLVDDIPIDKLPIVLTAEYQLCDLVKGDERVMFDVVREPFVPPTRIDLPEAGLAALKRGLQRAGFEATSFAWPPEHEPGRAPYRGLKPYEAKDAAIFFGRDAAIVRGLDQIRQVRNSGLDKLLVILGSSGAGKSSFMRAGLWPRLARDDHHFFPLPVVRPGGAAMSGEEGLIHCLAKAFAKVGVSSISLGEIRNRFKTDPDGDALHGYLQQLRDALVANSVQNTPEPTLILPIDQGEELYAMEGVEESAQLRAQFACLNRRDVSTPMKRDGLSLIALITIRTDLYAPLQNDALLRDMGRQMIDLTPMDRAEYKRIIEGPAQQATVAGNSLVITPDLVEQLLADTHGPDALPMLAFTLERLYTDYAAAGELTLEEYRLLGGVTGSLTAAIEAAMTLPHNAPVIPADKVDQHRLLRQAFIPWLAEVDEQSGERRRRVASWTELPAETHPMIERLTQMRLLVRDVRNDVVGEHKCEVVEIAHEALLRRWPALVDWLDADENSLRTISAVSRAALFWSEHQRHDDFLDHRGERLFEAEKLLDREDFKQRLSATGCEYLARCRASEDAQIEQQSQQLEKERKQIEKERQQTRRLRVAFAVAVLLAVGAVGAAVWGFTSSRLAQNERDKGLRTLSLMHAELSQQQTSEGNATRGVLLALEALPKSLEKPERPYVREAGAALYAPLNALHERKILEGHESDVLSAAFSPDGTQVVTASTDNTARVWNVQTGTVVAKLKGHKGPVWSAEYSPDGTQVVTASYDTTARVWDVRTGKPVTELTGHEKTVYSAAFSPDGTQVATASYDTTARVWDVQSGTLVVELTDHEEPVTRAAFSPDGTQVVTASTDNTARVWDVQSGTPVVELTRHGDTVISAAFSPDGTQVLTASIDNTARVWNVQRGTLVAELTGHKGPVRSAAFSSDGTQVVTASMDTTARVWDVLPSTVVAELTGHEGDVTSAAFSPDGTQVVTASIDSTARVWNVPNGELVAELTGHEGPVISAAFSPDGTQVVTASHDTTARTWDVQSGTLVTELTGHEGPVYRAAFNPDGTQVVTASKDTTARVWNVSAGTLVAKLIGHKQAVNSAAFSPDGTQVVTASNDYTARVWDVPAGTLVAKLTGHRGSVTSAAFSPDGTQVVTASWDATARVWNAQTGTVVAKLIGHENRVWTDQVNSAAFSPDGRQVVTASENTTARVWALQSGTVEAELTGHQGPVYRAAFSPDGTQVVTASEDTTARVWNVHIGTLVDLARERVPRQELTEEEKEQFFVLTD